MRTLLVLFATFALACGTCPAQDEIVPILPPANGDASVDAGLAEGGELDPADCVRFCGDGVIACSFDEPGGVPTLRCVMPAPCE